MILKKYNSIDIETDGLKIQDSINWLGIHTWDGTEKDKGTTIIIDCNTEQDKMHEYLKELENPKYINIFHNGKFDTSRIKFHYGYTIPMTHDTMLLAYFCSSASELINNRGKWLGLKPCAMRLLGVEDWDVSLGKKTSKSKKDVAKYLGYDVYYTRRIYEVLKKKIDILDIKSYKLALKATEVYRDIEVNGVPINVNQLRSTLVEYKTTLNNIDKQLIEYADINWNSPKQLQDLLYKKLKLPIPCYTDSGQPGTGIEALSKLKGMHQIVDLILKRREADKALTFLKDWLEKQVNGMIYPTFNLHTVVTGRTSCTNPNFQQVPRNKKLKTLFQSTDPEWEMVCLD